MKVRNEELIEVWAERPDAFALEPAHIQRRFRARVEARITELEGEKGEEALDHEDDFADE